VELTTLITIVTLGIFAETSYLVGKAIQPAKVKDGILLDTSVLIDGRIVAIARSGLISAKLIVTRSVVRELQFMADKADHDKRERARFGLDVIEQLQSIDGLKVEVIDDGITSQQGVDEQLINLSLKWHAKLCTIDYNLNKTARVQNVQVININELAHALRITYLPGETLEVKLQQPGQDSHQAVGYLDDGTMVVVDNAKSFIGQTLVVEATRVLQTAAGKMMFARHHEKIAPRVQKPRQNPPAATQSTSRKPSQQRRQPETRPSRKPNTPEDSLVDLANRS
jgi:uncharacterized protein YacL